MLAILLFATVFSALYASAYAGRRRWLPCIPAILLLGYCWVPTAHLAARIWEAGISSTPPNDPSVGAIVVLAGSVRNPEPPLKERLLNPDTYERCAYGAQLYHTWRALPVLVAGGTPESEPALAEAMRDELVRRDVPRDKIWMETRSRTTYENALYSAQLLRARQITDIVLVTNAAHMRRAESTFRKQGLRVWPAASSYHSPNPLRLRDFLSPSWTAIASNDDLLHEMGGMVWYRLRGRL